MNISKRGSNCSPRSCSKSSTSRAPGSCRHHHRERATVDYTAQDRGAEGGGQARERRLRLAAHVKITDLLLEVDRWCDFARHFTHLRTDQPTKDRPALLTIVLADAINLGLSKMAESCPGSSFHKLDTLRAWHVRDETYAKALAELVNYQHQLPFAAHWGGGTRHPPTASAIPSVAAVSTPAPSICGTALSQDSRSIPHLRSLRAVPHQGH